MSIYLSSVSGSRLRALCKGCDDFRVRFRHAGDASSLPHLADHGAELALDLKPLLNRQGYSRSKKRGVVLQSQLRAHRTAASTVGLLCRQ